MVNDIKQTVDKIDIPKELHERSTRGVKKAKWEQPKRIGKKPFVAAGVVAVLGFGLWISPPVQAMVDEFFQISTFEKSAHKEEISFGYHFDNLNFYEENVFDSLNQLEDILNVKIPFPEQLVKEERTKEAVEHRVLTDENGQLSLYDYTLATKERRYNVQATNKTEANANFSAETTDGTGLEKEMMINGVSSTLLTIKEMDFYTIYIENQNWKVIISCFDRASDVEGVADVNEQEVIKLAESIIW